MTYNYDQQKANNGTYKQEYVIKEPYGLVLYESDYQYRYGQYKNTAIREYKGKESELNVEATYRIKVKHKKEEEKLCKFILHH